MATYKAIEGAVFIERLRTIIDLPKHITKVTVTAELNEPVYIKIEYMAKETDQ